MTAGTESFADDFLTGTGLSGYREALTLAATWAGTELADPARPGVVAGYVELAETVGKIDLDNMAGIGLPRALGEAVSLLSGRSAVVTHPGYLAHLHCPPTVSSLAAEILVCAFNQSLDSFDQAPAATAVEQKVIGDLCATLGYGDGADGTFTSGGTQSNLQALMMARDLFARARFGSDLPAGLPVEAGSWRVLCTRQTHFSVRQALRILGLPGAVVEVPTDTAGRMRIDGLIDCVDRAVEAGTPIMALVLTAGTTDFGAIDPLPEAIAIAGEHDIWTHVDACAGGCLAFSENRRHLLRGIEMADSVAVDFHKLLFQAISCSALLVRRSESFEILADHADYLNPLQDSAEDVVNLVGKSLQTTRRFDALKVFVTLRALGRRRVGEMIDATCAAAAAAAGAVPDHPGLALVAPVATNTVVVRWQHPDLSEAECDDVNQAIRMALADSGRAVLGRSRAGGSQALKLTFVNPLVGPEAAADVIATISEEGQRILRARGREFTNA
ncbi:aspartate aminotransferase family protein [Mycolicibacterium sp. HK-90]|uniref:pyridoxal phosphate-dependent decarboxylase family protein n=1 Tax=Mycolicibacterium sp. HK-90 TaxID=3056937 RepID=UPI0026583A13|nr:aspartate aminotransferase family protein [Mycolicibacterium sp. HK-90]WKG02921.1 aspartate aminotransferase family protein [Mycolicibacterium sp. HK-90]